MKSKLSRKKPHRDHLIRNLATQLFLYGKIETTISKAKNLKPFADKIVTISKKENQDVAKKRLEDVLYDKKAVLNLTDKFKKDLAKRDGGYTRIRRKERRLGDGAEVAIVELVLSKETQDKLKEERKKKLKKEKKGKGEEKKGKEDSKSFWDRFRSQDKTKKGKKGQRKERDLPEKESTQRTTNK